MSNNKATGNQQQKEDIELDSSDVESEKGRSQGGSGLSSDDLDLAAEMMMYCSSNQEFKLATPENKFDKQQEGNQGGKQSTNVVQFNSSSSPTNKKFHWCSRKSIPQSKGFSARNRATIAASYVEVTTI